MDDYKNNRRRRRRHHQEKECEKMERYSRDLDLPHGFSGSGVTVTDDNVNKVSMTQNHYLQRFHEKLQHEEEEEDEGVELNLGLSLGGRFGVDKNAKKKKLLRSSSVVGTTPLFREDEAVAFPPLMRTSSLPTETEEEWRRRKEMQTLLRMEARRRRSEKQRVSREVAVAGAGVEETDMSLIKFGSSPVMLLPPGWGVGVPMKQVVLGDVLGKERGKEFQGLFGHPSSQGSVDSHGGSSSLVSEMDSEAFPGASSCGGGEAKSPASIQSTQERRGQDPVGSGGKTNEKLAGTSKAEVENPSNKPHLSKTIMGRQIGTNSMEDMPCVFTKGDGPNGRRIEGILYKYGKGEEVRIMCVCHGNFLSPAEFVKHAGCRDVANPLKHIVVNPSAAPF